MSEAAPDAVFWICSTLRRSGVRFVLFAFGLTELIRQHLVWFEVNKSRVPGRYVFVAAETTRQPVAGPEGLSWVVVGAPPQDGWEPQL